MRVPAEIVMYVRSMSKALRITAIFETKDEANAHMSRHKDQGVVARFGKYILLANLYDSGAEIIDQRGRDAA